MNNEIKEILDDLLFTTTLPNVSIKLNKEKLNQLLDYITNLQQENEKIRKMNMHEHKYGSDMEEKYLIEKNKNDRAVEYINGTTFFGLRTGKTFLSKYLNGLLNILNGRSDE